jgi:hypothetical protein
VSTFIRGRLTFANVASATALFVAFGGGALAATSSFTGPNGQIHGCANKTTGALRALKTGGKCGRKEIALVWSQQGPQGRVGATGPPGTNGTNGLNGTNGTNGQNGANGATKVVVHSGTNNAACDPGEVATGGGAAISSPGGSLTTSIPETFNAAATPQYTTANTGTPNAWGAGATNGNPSVWVICASP